MAHLRAGLIGLGMMGRHHARVLRGISGVDLVALADPHGDPHRLAGSMHVGTSVQELISAGIDMAVVAVPTEWHEEVGLALADAGVHALVEKPIATDSAAGMRLLDAFESRGLIGAVGHIERFNPALQNLRERIARGELGEIFQVATRRQGPFPSRVADVGVVKDLATHDLDLTAWLVKSPYTSVFARTSMRSGREHEDLVAVTGALKNDVVTSHLVNWLSPMKERTITVTGEKGTYVADTISADLTFFENGTVATEWDSVAAFRGVTEGNMVRPAIAKPEPLMVELEGFRDAVGGEPGNIVTMREGLETLRVAEAVLASARDEQLVRIPSS